MVNNAGVGRFASIHEMSDEDWEVQTRVDGQMSIVLRARKKALADEAHTAAAMREFVRQVRLPPNEMCMPRSTYCSAC